MRVTAEMVEVVIPQEVEEVLAVVNKQVEESILVRAVEEVLKGKVPLLVVARKEQMVYTRTSYNPLA